MGEVTPEMVERLKRVAALGVNALLNEAIYAILSEWEEQGQRIADLKFALGDSAGWFDRAMAAERSLAEAREKLAKVATLLDIIKRANEPCDAEYGYCVHCACVEALAAAKGE